jgi:cellulose synthase operon protein C
MTSMLKRRFLFAPLALIAAVAGAAPGESDLTAAQQALGHGDGIGAEIALKRALDAGAERSAVAAAMGEAMLDQGDRRKARDWLGKGEFAPDTAVYGFRMLGLLERQDGNLAAAGNAYNRALAITRDDSMLWVDIGRLRYAGGEQAQSIGAADEALKHDPANIRALELRGQLVRDQFGPVAALPWFEAGLTHAPDDLDLLGEYAATLGEAGRTQDALTVARRLAELAPGSPKALFIQAVIAARAGNYALAKGILDRIEGPFRDSPAALLLTGALEIEDANPNIAIEALDRLVRLQPANPRAQELLARALYDAGELKDLTQRFAPLAQRPGASPYLLTLLARAFEDQGRRDLAAPLLDRASAERAEIAPVAELSSSGDVASQLRTLLASGQNAQAAAVAEQLRAVRPGFAPAQSFAGDAQLALGRPAEALDRYRRAAEIRLSDDLLLKMLFAMVRSGQGQGAGELLAGFIANNPQNRVGARAAAGLAAQNGDWDLSRDILESLRMRGGSSDVRLLCDLSLAQLRGGDAEDAVVTAEAAYRLQPASAVASQALGAALAEAGERPRAARSLLNKARAIGGNNPLLEEALAKLPK